MNILVISNSLIILELFKRALENKNLQGELTQSAQEAKSDSYSAIFLDDTLPNILEEIDFIHNNFDFNEIVIIGEDRYNIASLELKKPFLMSDIESLLLEIQEEYSSEEIGSILDINEIKKIKEIMKQSEEEPLESNLFYKLKKEKKIIATKKEASKLLKKLCKMDKKERKKLLKKVQLTITIKVKR